MRKALAVTVGVIAVCALGTVVFAQRQQTNTMLWSSSAIGTPGGLMAKAGSRVMDAVFLEASCSWVPWGL